MNTAFLLENSKRTTEFCITVLTDTILKVSVKKWNQNWAKTAECYNKLRLHFLPLNKN